MNKNRNKVAAMMMVAAITVSSVAMPVEAAVVGNEGIAIKREKENKINDEITDVVLNEANFPDDAFREILAENFNIENNGKGIISVEKIRNTKRLNLKYNKNKIYTLKGIEKFIFLENLSCEGEFIEKIDFSKNINLKELNFKNNQTREIILPNNSLETIELEGNNIQNIDLKNNTKLKILNLSSNKIENINLEKFDLLENLYLNKNSIQKINLSKNVNLKNLNIESNPLLDINLEENINLESLFLGNDNISSINLKNNKNLLHLNINKSNITELDLSSNKKLNNLYLEENDNLEKINLRENINLSDVWIRRSKIKSLDLSNKIYLQNVNIESNFELEDIDFKGSRNIKDIDIINNKIKKIDLSDSDVLSSLRVIDVDYGYINLNPSAPIQKKTLENSYIDNINVEKEKNYIDLEKLFPGIDMSRLDVKTSGVVKDGAKLLLGNNKPRNIEYEYNTGGNNNTIKVNIIMYLNYDETGELPEGEGVTLDEKNFPDKNFRNYISDITDTKLGDKISANILSEVTRIDVRDMDIKDLTGIEYFKNARTIECSNNKIKKLDVSKNENLEVLSCAVNLLTNIIIPENNKIETLNCTDNMLTTIDTSKLKNITSLSCSENNLENLELYNMLNLQNLKCKDNKLHRLNLSKVKNLIHLDCSSNELSVLDVSKNEKLENLNCSKNKNLNNIDLSKNVNLEIINCSFNNIKEIDLLENNKLANINLSFNNIESVEKLYLQNKPKLAGINLENNNISEIDLTNNKKLRQVFLANNKKMRNLDLSEHEEIETIGIDGTEIGKIKINEMVSSDYIHDFRNEIKLDVPESKKYIDLKKEFNIDEKDIKDGKFILTYPEEEVKLNGNRIEWTKNKPDAISYRYNCGGRKDRVWMYIDLIINEDGEEITPPVNPNPDQGGSGGGSGTTTPDNKPDTKPEEKPNKPIELQGKIVGKNRYETAAKIADQMGSYNTVILVNSDKSMADGLSAASLSGKKNAPILLVKKNSIPSETMARLEKAENVYIIGGNNVISKKVENQLKGKKITRISGKDRYDTSAKIANLLGDYDTAFIVNGAKGEADAMSVSSVAAKYGAPILLTNGKTSKHLKKANVRYFVIGGKAVVSRALEDRYDADRISGVDRYSTNRKIIDEFYYDSKKVYFAKGDTLVDALAVSALAKEDGVVLVSKKANHKKLEGKKAIQVGGMDFEIDVK